MQPRLRSVVFCDLLVPSPENHPSSCIPMPQSRLPVLNTGRLQPSFDRGRVWFGTQFGRATRASLLDGHKCMKSPGLPSPALVQLLTRGAKVDQPAAPQAQPHRHKAPASHKDPWVSQKGSIGLQAMQCSAPQRLAGGLGKGSTAVNMYTASPKRLDNACSFHSPIEWLGQNAFSKLLLDH